MVWSCSKGFVAIERMRSSRQREDRSPHSHTAKAACQFTILRGIRRSALNAPCGAAVRRHLRTAGSPTQPQNTAPKEVSPTTVPYRAASPGDPPPLWAGF